MSQLDVKHVNKIAMLLKLNKYDHSDHKVDITIKFGKENKKEKYHFNSISNILSNTEDKMRFCQELKKDRVWPY